MDRGELNKLTGRIIGAAIEVHKQLGPGLLEPAYESCLAHEFQLQGIAVERQKPITISYNGVHVEAGFRLDFMVANQVVVELKSVETVLPVHEAQVMTYLKLTGCNLGLLINFNVIYLKLGVKRIIRD